MAHKWNHRRKKHHVFGRKKEAAIRAIALGPVETKKWFVAIQGLTTPNPALQTNATIYNLFYNLPKGMAGDSETTALGNEIHSRGVKIYIQTTSTIDTEVQFRATVLSSENDHAGPSGLALLSNNYAVYEQQASGWPQIRQHFNMQLNHVLLSKTWSIKKNYATQVADESFVTMWAPITGRKVSTAEEGADTVVQFSYLKGKQYFLVLEAYAVGSAAPVPWAGVNLTVNWAIYFKDP